ncbi:hypothetical protein CERSUDRAFT_93910 [Gelatoporia subvermispora B]|uniref:Uncharacterized protein n=1 Tax=Ceriporiopsis subvermispora (strain B) TaxID=914234 RepID=M2RHW1_CERS8|nr:hypothetical protein CERSUDRAFT_93910 [Gelatoporia subvermispora B]
MSPAPSTSLSSSPAARSPLPAAIPLKFRRKSQGPADVSPDPVVHAPFARTSAQRVWRDSYSSDASSPIASSAILSSEPSSPIEFSRVYYQSSPVNHYGCGARDPYDYAQQGSWTSSTDLPPSPSSSYYYARPRHHYSHSFRSYGSSFSYSSPSEGSEEPPMSSDFDVDAASVDLEDTRVELEDTDATGLPRVITRSLFG